MRTIFFLVRKEFLQIFRDHTTVAQIFMIPVVQLLVLANAATFDLKRTRVLVVDEDRTTVSGGLVQRLEGGRQFQVVRHVPNAADVDQPLLDREVTAVIHIPRRFEEDLVQHRRATVQLILNAEEGAATGIVQSSANAILSSYARELDLTLPAVRNASAPVRPAPLDLRTQRWFNPTRNYQHYMVPALMVSLTTIIGLLLTAQNITREHELGTLEQLNVTPMTKTQFITAKLIPFWLLSLVIFSIGLTIGKLVFGIPMRGNLLLVYLAAMVYLVVVLGLGAVDLHHNPHSAAGDVRGLLRDADLPSNGRAVYTGGLDAGLGSGGGAGEPGEALRVHHAGGAGAGSRPGNSRSAHSRSSCSGSGRAQRGGSPVPKVDSMTSR